MRYAVTAIYKQKAIKQLEQIPTEKIQKVLPYFLCNYGSLIQFFGKGWGFTGGGLCRLHLDSALESTAVCSSA